MEPIESQELRQELYTVAQVAVILSLSIGSVKKLITEGWLASCHPHGMPKARRVTRKMIDDYIAKCDGGR